MGGGTAGAIAGIAAARTGARTLVVEQQGHLGGTLAFGMSITGAVDASGRWALGGTGREVLQRLEAQGGATRAHLSEMYASVIGQSPEMLRIELLRMTLEAGAKLLFHSTLVDVTTDGQRVTGVVVANKNGLEKIPADIVVDATGDADVVARAGGRFTFGRPGDALAQPSSRIFLVGNVDIDRTFDYLENNPDDLQPPPGWRKPGTSVEGAEAADTPTVEHLRTTPGINIEGFAGLVRKAKAAGDLNVPRAWVGMYTYPGRREVGINFTRAHGVDGTDSDSITQAEVETQLQMADAVEFLRKYVPGFEGCYVVATPYQLGVRESRHVVGHYALTESDVLSGASFDDQIGRAAYALDIHDIGEGVVTGGRKVSGGGITIIPIEKSYGVPMRCLIPVDLSNVVVAGRSISAEHEAAGSVRGQAVCMMTGHAAGTIAALAAMDRVEPRNLNYDKAKETLLAQDAVIDVGEPLIAGVAR
ncbi:FAD-dependent oxidoreductase [Jiangella asiatica]|uniref:FAD-dependent oxidoreductase n=1 Tax=Jiangella asiatica TaxID=2530372 RepID=UPI0013A5CDE4|nr:FAD-dependent oxidoreductase [Jiangella asiatica]